MTLFAPPKAIDRTLRVLIIDDDEEDQLILRDMLGEIKRWAIHVDWISRWEEALAAFKSDEHDVYLVDYRLGAHNGLTLVADARANHCQAPIIMLTSDGDVDVELAALKVGATDFLVKGRVDAPLLEHALRFAIEQSRHLKILSETNERLQSLDNLKAELLASVSHELRSPLATIQTILSNVQDQLLGPINDEQAMSLETAYNSTKHLDSLVSDLLDLSVLEDGRQMQLNRSIFTCEEVIGESLELVALRIEHNGQRIHTTLDAGNAAIYADRRRMTQVLVNLLTNASKFSPPETDIECGCRMISDGDVMLFVTDEGIGLSAEQATKVFDKFHRVTDGARGFVEGTGLGLFLCKQIMESHGGSIGCTSEPGKGSTFFAIVKVIDSGEAKRPDGRDSHA